MFSQFFNELNDSLILTVNSRLALHLQTLADQHYQKTQSAWETPRILPLSRWLENLFHRYNDEGLWLLTDFQEQCLWEKCITHSPHASGMLHPGQLAVLVKQAWERLKLWQVPLQELDVFSEQPDVQGLLEWMNAFGEACRAEKWITSAELPNFLHAQELKQPLTLPLKMIVMGFDDVNPATQALLEAFKKRIPITTEHLSIPSVSRKIILEDTAAELTVMARWMKQQWEQNPQGKFGCVIPELSALRPLVARVFTDVFCIEHILPGVVSPPLPFNISAGMPLAQHPLVAIALTLLKWCHSPLPISELAAILQSPYLCADETDAMMGAQCDALLREQNYVEITLLDLLSVMPVFQARYPRNTGLLRWRGLFSVIPDKKTQMLPSQWAHQVMVLLKTMQWPGVQSQSSAEFQALERFKKLLHEFSQLDFIYHPIDFQKAYHLLASLSQNTIFQPKSHQEPIQVMGVLEASGITFDAVWVMGLHDGVWPSATKPHPLIPYKIQQHHQMPHATAQRELQFCELITTRLQNCATNSIFSSPQKEGDYHLSPSHLIQSIPQCALTDLLLTPQQSYAEKLFHTQQLETLTDDHALPVNDYARIRGGSYLIELQALCPFRAFSTIRLQAKALSQPTLGISPLQKGVLIHHVLFELWNTLQDQKTLNALSDTALDDLIVEKLEKTLLQPAFQVMQKNRKALFVIEKKRIGGLLKRWMMLEKQRLPFKIKKLEYSQLITLHDLPLSIRLDRIDELSDGSLLLIDYKTSPNKIDTWLKEKLTSPQLPLYAVFHDESTVDFKGIAFAEVCNANITFRGIAHENQTGTEDALPLTPIDKTKNELQIRTWDALTAHWKKTVLNLSDEFCQGRADVNPIRPDTCQRCQLQSLCRYHG